MPNSELISLIGDVIVAVDELRSTFPRGSATRNALDEHRNALDASQRTLGRRIVENNTPEFQELTASLSEVNAALHRTINEVNKIVETLEALVKFIGVVQKIIELLPVAA